MKLNKYLHGSIYLLSIAINLILAIIFFSSVTTHQLVDYFNSDDLFIPAIYKDLIIDKGSLQGWQLGTAIYLFPNMIACFLVLAITNNVVLATYLLSLIQFCAFIFLINKVIKEACVNFSIDILILTNVLFSFFILVWVDDYRIVFQYFFPLHMGVFLIALLNIYLSLKYLKNYQKKFLIAIAILNILAIASDGIFIVFYILPSLVALLLIYSKLKNSNIKRLFFINLISIVSGKLFLLIFKWIFRIKSQEPGFNFPNLVNSLHMFLSQLHDYLFSGDLKTIIWLISIVSLILIFTYILKNFGTKIKEELLYHYFYLWFIVAFSLIVLLAPVFMGIYYDYSCIRYNVFVYYALVGSFVFILFHIFYYQNVYKFLSVTAILFLVTFLTFKILHSNVAQGMKNNLNYYPEIAMAVDQLTESENLKAGVAEYWHARVVTMFSKNKVLVNHVYLDKLAPYHFLNKMSHYLYYPNDSIIWYNFIINHPSVDTNFIRSTFGDYKVISRGNYAIIKVPEFRYNPDNFSIVLKDSLNK